MSRVRTALVALSVLVLAAAGCGGESGPEPAPPAPTDAAPAPPPAPSSPEGTAEVPETLAFTAATIGGGELDGAELAGTPVAFWFWAAWCPRCAAAADDVRQVADEYAGQVQVVGVAGLGSGEDSMRSFIDQHQLDGFPHLADDDGEVWQRFGVTTQEYFVILDAAGEVVHDGPLSAAELRDTLAGLAG